MEQQPAAGKAALARFPHAAASSRHTVRVWFPAIWLEDLAAVPAGPGFWIRFLAGFGAKKRGSLFCPSLAARRFQVEPDCRKWRPFSFSVFLDYAYKRAYRWLLAEQRCEKKRDEVD